jgi:hypothetical protein
MTMIYRKDEFVQDDEKDSQFPIKTVDRLEAVDGSEQRFVGRAALNMQTPFGIEQIPISFEIQAGSIQEAFSRYRECAEPKINEVKEHIQNRLEQLRRAEQSRIVTPGEAGAPGGIINFDDFRGGS